MLLPLSYRLQLAPQRAGIEPATMDSLLAFAIGNGKATTRR